VCVPTFIARNQLLDGTFSRAVPDAAVDFGNARQVDAL
jgi:hypothetical protein